MFLVGAHVLRPRLTALTARWQSELELFEIINSDALANPSPSAYIMPPPSVPLNLRILDTLKKRLADGSAAASADYYDPDANAWVQDVVWDALRSIAPPPPPAAASGSGAPAGSSSQGQSSQPSQAAAALLEKGDAPPASGTQPPQTPPAPASPTVPTATTAQTDGGAGHALMEVDLTDASAALRRLLGEDTPPQNTQRNDENAMDQDQLQGPEGKRVTF